MSHMILNMLIYLNQRKYALIVYLIEFKLSEIITHLLFKMKIFGKYLLNQILKYLRGFVKTETFKNVIRVVSLEHGKHIMIKLY